MHPVEGRMAAQYPRSGSSTIAAALQMLSAAATSTNALHVPLPAEVTDLALLRAQERIHSLRAKNASTLQLSASLQR